MASLGMTFDPTAVEPATGRVEPFPPGRYKLRVVESDVAPTKKGTGRIAKLTIEVLEGEYRGRQMFENINVQNDSVQAQEIGQKQLSAICKAMGINTIVADSQDLHYHPFEAEVDIEPSSGANPTTGRPYPDKNRIKRYLWDGEGGGKEIDVKAVPAKPQPKPAAPAAAKPAPARQATPAAAPTGSRPWQRTRAGTDKAVEDQEIPF